MTILAVDTSAAIASVALLKDGTSIGEASADPTKKHAETLLPLIQELLKTARTELKKIDLFAVDIGPGSFTGVRIGVCAVNAMAFALGRSVIAVDSLRTLAEPHIHGAAPICALIDAGHGACYCARYENGVCTQEPGAQDTETLLASLPSETVVVRDAVPRAADVAKAAWRLRESAVSAAVPLYVQPSQAERLFNQRKESAAHE